MRRFLTFFCTLIAFRSWVAALLLTGGSLMAVDFQRDVRPVLAAHCFKCHGPDQKTRKAKFRLDVRPEFDMFEEILNLIDHTDPDELMPPPKAKKPLSAAQKQTLRAWVKEGAPYTEHWAFIPPKMSALPKVKQVDWPRNNLDYFTLRQLESEGRAPSPKADRYQLIRRLSLDLIGIPPSAAEVRKFVNNQHPDAYGQLVDTLLARPEYGEHWARAWLDLARYADTNGYEKDRPRSIWPWRDWVVNAINSDMPFNQFTIEQIAGDMIPNATQAQRVATGFHRNTMVNEEGGIDPLEFRFYAMIDRVNTTSTTWLGLTMGCAQCHTHKFDPVPHQSYYEMMAFFNNTAEPEWALVGPGQNQKRLSVEKQISEKLANISVNEEKFRSWLKVGREKAFSWKMLKPKSFKSNLGWMELQDDGSIFVQGDTAKHDIYELELTDLPAGITAFRIEVLPDERLPKGGPGRAYYEGPKGDFFLSELKLTADGKPVRLSKGTENYAKQWIGKGKPGAMAALDGDLQTGWSVSGREGKPSQAVWQLAAPLTAKSLKLRLDFSRHYSASLGRFRVSVTASKREPKARNYPAEIEMLFIKGKLNQDEQESLRNYYIENSNDMAKARRPIEALRKRIPKDVTTLVMQERPAAHTRLTHRHHRGEFLSPREAVSPKVLPFLPPLGEDNPRNRLGFSQWLVDEKNPLTARVVVNRYWASFFGEGLVATPDDFGYTGAAPHDPEFLDWLAVRFMREGWSPKKLHRLIVTSATYRQVRSARYRLSSEQIRDSVLSVSGLLYQKVGGPSVFPPQPKSMGEGIYGGGGWRTSSGPDRYRRSLYTYKKRSMPFAMHDTFDGPSHETCVVHRETSNTPLQALTLLNDPFFNEAAQKLGQWAVEQKGKESVILKALFEKCLIRPPDREEQEALMGFYQNQLKRFQAGELEAGKIAGKGEGEVNQRASWTTLARVILNTDEFITRN